MTLKRTSYRIFAWGSVIIWMLVIFFLSHQQGGASSQLSSGITEKIVRLLETLIPFQFDLKTLHMFVRKSAHFFAYFVLSMLLMNAFRAEQRTGYQRVIWTITISVLYACSDEIHQLFIPGRSGEIRDVLIDSTGAIFGICFYLLMATCIQKVFRS